MRYNSIVCFLILHYNGLAETEACIASVLALEGQERIRIVVADNASPDGSGKKLAEKYGAHERMDVLCLEENRGFSAGNNAGFAYAVKKYDVRFLVVCNNDIQFPQTDFIERTEGIYEKNRFDILRPDIVVTGSGEHQNPMCADPPTLFEVRKTILRNRIGIALFPLLYPAIRKRLDRQQEEKRMRTGAPAEQADVVLQGSCMIYAADYFQDREKLFEPETFFYYEEFIQTLQCRRAGKNVLYSPKIRVFHLDGRATAKDGGTEKERTLKLMRRMLAAARVYRTLV